MPCFFPLPATLLPGGGRPIVHKRFGERKPTPPGLGRDIKLPCGKCIGCRLEHGRQWAVRSLHETQLHQHNCALTLTYSDDSNYEAVASEDRDYPHQDVWIARKSAREFSTSAKEELQNRSNTARVDNSRSNKREVVSLSKGDHQKFVKRLRKEVGEVRYLMCGEYGSKLARPHFHYIIFGYDFPDKRYCKKSLSGSTLYRSEQLEKIWTFGHAWIGEVDFKTCAYVASYITKKVNGDKAIEHYRRTDEAGNDYWLTPEFSYMSRRPGIATKWWEKFHQDVTTGDSVLINGTQAKPPRFYDKLLEEMDPVKYGITKLLREEKAKQHQEDSTPARLRDREIVTTARFNQKQRNLEK